MRSRGFTLIELMLVLALIALLAGIVGPIATSAIQRAKESTLKENLFVLRKAIDDHYADKGAYPGNLEALAEKRYIRKVPVDPITERIDSWQLTREEEGDQDAGIVDVHSGAEGAASDGTNYRDW